MPTLNWIGKEAVLNHHQEVPFHLLRSDPDLSVGDPDSGNVQLDVSAAGSKSLTLRWLDIRQSRWSGAKTVAADEQGLLHLVTPTEEGYWVALIQ